MPFADNKAAQRQHLSGEDANDTSATMDNEYEYEEILAKIDLGKTQWILLLISGLLTLSSMVTQTSVGIIAIASQCEFEMDQAEKGIMMAACVAGVFLSTYFWGYAGDAFGRRTVALYGTLVAVLLQFISMFITNILVFNILNLIMGISLGAISAVVYPYLSEFNMMQHRAVMINYTSMFVSIAAIYVPATAWLVLSADWSWTIVEGLVFRPWRLIIFLNLLPGLIGSLMLLPFPESPKLLLAHGKDMEALAAVEWICKLNTGGRSIAMVLNNDEYRLKPEAALDDDLLAQYRGFGVLTSIWKATVPLFHKPHATNFIISVIAIFGMFFSSSGMQIWYPEIVNRSSADNSGNTSTVCDILDASFEQQRLNATTNESEACDDSISAQTYIDNMIVGCAFLLGFLIQGALLNPIGRKNVLLFALSISTLSGILLHVVANAKAVLVLFCLYILMPGLSISNMCGGVVDLVPTHLRGKAVSISLTLGRLGVIVAANLIGVMLEPLCNTTFAIFTGSMFISAVLVYFLPI